MNIAKYFLVIVYHCSNSFVDGFDFVITPAVIVGGISTLGTFSYDHTICQFWECCRKVSIPANFTLLQTQLHNYVYGQPIVQEVVVNALKSHWRSDVRQKALTLSFHGWPGGGKNYVVRFIQESLYSKGSASSFVHHFTARIHFPQHDKVEIYKQELYSWIKGNVTKCGKQLFIFDEVDKMPPGVLNILTPVIDYKDSVDRVDYRESVFMFLSNTGSKLITEHYMKLWKEGIRREDMELKHFENVISKGSFNEEGGFHHSDTIKSNLIDHYIPFLPLERHHVRLCIIDQFKLRGVPSPTEKDIEVIFENIEWGPSPENLFSTTGCKRISQKVGMVVQKVYGNRNEL